MIKRIMTHKITITMLAHDKASAQHIMQNSIRLLGAGGAGYMMACSIDLIDNRGRDVPAKEDALHPSHKTRQSDASSYDEVCTACGATDIAGGGWGKLAEPCTAVPSAITTVPRYSTFWRLFVVAIAGLSIFGAAAFLFSL